MPEVRLLQQTIESGLASSRAIPAADSAFASDTYLVPDDRNCKSPQHLLDEEAYSILERRAGQNRPSMRKGIYQALGFILLPVCTFGILSGIGTGQWVMVLVMSAIAAMGIGCWKSVLTDDVKTAGSRLSESDDIRVVGPLADMLSWPDPRYWEIAAKGLERLLPRLKASDSHILAESQRKAIYEKMTMRNAARHDRFLISVLRALEQIGDETAIPHVARLANTTSRGPAEQRVAAAAKECLDTLSDLLGRGHIPHRLLRPVEISEEGLLRPARNDETSPQLLLRESKPPV